MQRVLLSIGGSPNMARLAALARELPDQVRAAAHELALAERQLAEILVLRATGQEVRPSRIAAARMALARRQRDADDLQRILDALPGSLQRARDATGT